MNLENNEYSQDDEKWYGVPPKGDRPLPSRWRYIGEVLAVILVEFTIWGIYRYYSAPYISPFGSMKFYLAHIVAAPTLALTPILIYWRFIRKEKGVPFRFTRKRLFSGVLVGLTAAIVWRVLEMLVYDRMAVIAGGYQPGTFGFFSMLGDMTIPLFLVMTFTQFFIVGPVEEFEFRAFAQDQAARVLPNWGALVFSSILFGLSHIPIALTVYKMSLPQLIIAEIGWMTAGAVFGALYMWSRNIWATIIMHGMGNWQLSVYLFSSSYIPGGMTTMTDIIVGTLESLVVDTIMILLFYLVFKFYWEPQRKGDAVFGGKLRGVSNYMLRNDEESIPLTSIVSKLTAIVVGVLLVVLGTTYAFADSDVSKLVAQDNDTISSASDLTQWIEETENTTGVGTLAEGETKYVNIEPKEGRVIKSVELTLTWTDEPDIQRVRTFENTPDTFSVALAGLNATADAQGSNKHGEPGNVTVSLDIPEEQLSQALEDNDGMFNVSAAITLDNAGDYEASTGLGMIQIADDSNDYEYSIVITWLVSPGTHTELM